jgi:hypothetical protein
MSIKKFDTGAITLLPDKIERLRETMVLGPMLVPKHMRDTQLLTIFDPINNINHEAVRVEHWEPIREGSCICMPVDLTLCMIDAIETPPEIWAYLNQAITGSPVESCTPVNWVVHGQPYEDLVNIKNDEGAMKRTMERAVEYIGWERDDAQFRSDAAFLQNLHLQTHEDQANYLTGAVKVFSVTCPWK